MKSNLSVSVDSELLAEVRRGGFNLSQLVTKAFQDALNKPFSTEEKEIRANRELKELKAKVYFKAQEDRETTNKAIRQVSFLSLKKETTQEKIIFWKTVLDTFDELKKVSPAPLPKGD